MPCMILRYYRVGTSAWPSQGILAPSFTPSSSGSCLCPGRLAHLGGSGAYTLVLNRGHESLLNMVGQRRGLTITLWALTVSTTPSWRVIQTGGYQITVGGRTDEVMTSAGEYEASAASALPRHSKPSSSYLHVPVRGGAVGGTPTTRSHNNNLRLRGS